MVPFLFDQYFWGQRIADLGAGPRPIPFKKLTPRTLADSIQKMVNDTDMHAAATSMGEKMSHEDGVFSAIRLINESIF